MKHHASDNSDNIDSLESVGEDHTVTINQDGIDSQAADEASTKEVSCVSSVKCK